MKPLAILTGGSRGIGRAILGRLVDGGYECLVVGLSVPDTESAQVTFVRHDLSETGEAESATHDVSRYLDVRGQPASVLVNNAGGGFPRPARDTRLPELQTDVTLNLIAPMLLTNVVLHGMMAAGQGTIVNIASTAGRTGVAYLSAYSAAKAGLIAYTQSLAAECTPHGVRAFCVCPGAVATSSAGDGRAELSRLHGQEPGVYEKAMAQRTGLGRLVTPEEVAEVVQWLVVRGGSAISGQTLNLCGALQMG